MKQGNFLKTAARSLLRVAPACALAAAAHVHAAAQTRAGDGAPAPTQAAQADAARVVEEFELNIDLRRINERDFYAETEAGTRSERGLRLRVGVALGASEIDVLLQGVRGRVRFRANLAPVQRLLDARGAAQPPP